MKRSLLSIFISVIVCTSLCAQDVNYVEYFWDSDPGARNATELSVSPGEFISQISTIETAGLEPGFHHLYIRVCDENNACSLYASVLVLVQGTDVSIIDHAEYFWDSDPGAGQGNPLVLEPGTQISENYVFETAGLDPGYHYLYIRVRDDTQTWSLYQKVLVFIDGSAPIFIIEMEYFWDTDPGVGNATPIDIDSGEIVSGDFPVSTDGLELGIHWLHVRVLDVEGAWSLYHRLPINICTNFSPIADFDFEIVGDQFNFVSNSSFADNLSWQVDGMEQSTEPEFSIIPSGEQEVCLIASNECASDTLCFVAGAPFLEAINPNLVSNDGSAAITATGYLLETSSEVEIRLGGESIAASNLEIVSGEELAVDFDFSDETVGFWDFVVILENGNELILVEGLELSDLVSVGEIENDQPVLFPNPANRYAEIGGIDVREIIVYSTDGMKVLRTNENKFSVESLVPALYSVLVSDDSGGVWVLRLVVE